jgi:antitoxin (DNA-binding transcriptional repressor) of toxin-antitoxin stability system
MRSITLSQLRYTRLWLPWLKAGETIELRERNCVIAHIIPRKGPIEKSAARRASRRPGRS